MKQSSRASRAEIDLLPTPGQKIAAVELKPFKAGDRVKASFSLDPKVHEHLRRWCSSRGVKQQDVFAQALDLWLRSQGEPGILELAGEATPQTEE